MAHTLVAGGTRGIGLALVNLLATTPVASAGTPDAPRQVSVIGRRSAPAAWDQFPHVRYWPVNLLEPAALDQVLADILDKHGPVNGLVFCQRYRDAGDAWEGELQTSLTATKHIIDRLSESFGPGDKAIVMVSSIATRLIANEQPAGYHVAKAGLSQLARYYAVQLGPKGIRVNCVSPAVVLKDEARAFYAANPSLIDLYERMTPLGRMGNAAEIAQVILFLLSSASSFITGQEITVDGGITIQWHEALARQLLGMSELNITRPPQDNKQ
jgi:3-oxoacyl-[acyl-carrier protein] reductase